MGVIGTSAKLRYQAAEDELSQTLSCHWPIGDWQLPVSQWLGHRLRISTSGAIACSHCGQATRKSYSQGYCYPCFKRLARCDLCMMSPTRCHFAKGTCREPQWAQDFCFAPHLVYLANSSSLKVGITRPGQEFTRWTDQGAVQGLVLLHTHSRQQAGELEAQLTQWVSDRSNWRLLISQTPEPIDLAERAEYLLGLLGTLPTGAQVATQARPLELEYPVNHNAPAKTLKISAQTPFEGELLGIRGQYLLFTEGALNVRNLTSWEIEVNNLTEPNADITSARVQPTAADTVKIIDNPLDNSQMELFT